MPPLICKDTRHPHKPHHHGRRRPEGWYWCNYVDPSLCNSVLYVRKDE